MRLSTYDLIARYGYAAEADKIQKLYLSGRKDEAAAAVPAELLERSSLIGTESYVRDRLQAFAGAGVTVLNVTPVDDAQRLLARVRELMD